MRVKAEGGKAAPKAAATGRAVAKNKAKQTATPAVGDAVPVASMKKASHGQLCLACGDNEKNCRWVTTLDKDGKEVKVGPLCWDCNCIYSPYKMRFAIVEKWFAFLQSPEGEKEVGQKEAKKSKSTGSASASSGHDRGEATVVSRFQSAKTSVVRDLWVANAAEFRDLFGQSSHARMPRCPSIQVPSETSVSGELEWVYLFAVCSAVYPLRKLQLVWEHGAIQDMRCFQATADVPAQFKGQPRVHFTKAVERMREQWSGISQLVAQA